MTNATHRGLPSKSGELMTVHTGSILWTCMGPDKNWHTGGWAVRQLCSQPLDTLFFVHVAPSYWKTPTSPPPTSSSVACGWVNEYCPKVRHIVKIDHDVGVHPFELRRYLDRYLPLKDSSIHCNTLMYTAVFRYGGDPHCVPEDQLAMDVYPHYCSGFAMIMTTDTMRKLYRASKFVKGYQIDDAYVSGHLAQLANVGHEHIGQKVSAQDTNVNTERMLNRTAIFTHELSAYGNSVGRRALWELMIWTQIMEAPDGRAFNSSYRLVDQIMTNATHRGLPSKSGELMAVHTGSILWTCMGPDKEWHTGGWAVRQLCSQPLDTLFFVHVAPSYWKTRIHLRATLFEEAARAAFNWTGVFFVAQDNNSLSNLWTNLEAELMGDVVVFPYNDSYYTTAYKFVRGMRWVNEYCPKVRHIVKIDHDVGVQPFELRRYLDRYLPLKDSSIHCNTLMYTAVFRYGGDPHCVPEDQLAMDVYPHYCSGFAMIMTTDTMRKLYRASKFVKGYQIDDAYVSGHLAQLANVGHVHIGRKVSAQDTNVNTERMLNRAAIFTHELSAYGNSVGRRALWELMIWTQIMEAPDGRAFNSSYRLVDQMYRDLFHETRPTALFSIISTIYIMAIMQREPAIQVPLACAHRIDSMDVHGPGKEWHTGGWAVRQLCSQPLDTLFFVHVAPSKWERRIHLRATLFEEAARAAFNWTGVFFVGQDEDPLVNLWTKLEAEVTGDVVVFPYNDSFFTIVNKIVRGMRWVSEYCPRVRHIVKIDHDVGVQPFELRRYLNENLPLENSSIHCSVWKHVKVLRDGRNKHCVPEDQLAMDYYPLYCSGRAMIMTMETMGKLYRASHLVKGYQIDDTYVSGHLALLANVGHVDITKNVSWDENRNMSWDEYAERHARTECDLYTRPLRLREFLWSQGAVGTGAMGASSR
ncbi:hypothetical protein MTO96_030816 [Rhipicephalus appendiculatus]